MTGAAGKVGAVLRERLPRGRWRWRYLDLKPVESQAPDESLVLDVRHRHEIERAVQGAHGVIHLGGIPDEDDFYDLVDSNVVGTYNVLEAARRAGVRRVILASTNRVTGFYPTTAVVKVTDPPRPDSFYAASKVAGEALGRLYSDKFGLEVVCIRIASLGSRPRSERELSTWVSFDDCAAAFRAAMDHPAVDFAVFYAASSNSRGWWDLDAGRALGFEPRDDAEDFAEEALAQRPETPPATESFGRQSGSYTAAEYSLDRQRDRRGGQSE